MSGGLAGDARRDVAEPGCAEVRGNPDGTYVVVSADPLIRVAVELLNDPDTLVDADGVLQLDSAGEYRYRFAYAESALTHVYERL